MRAIIIFSLAVAFPVTHAKNSKGPRGPKVRGAIEIPACDQHLLNVRGFLHDPVTNAPFFHPNFNGRVGYAPVTIDTFERAPSLGKFVMSADDERGAYLVQPQQRALMDVPGFESRIPSRDLQYIRSLTRAGFTTTHDKAPERVLDMCARVIRRDRENGLDRVAPSWVSATIKRKFMQLFLHPDRLAHSVEVWWQGELVGGLFITFHQGVPMGETMFYDGRFGKNIGKLVLHALLERLEKVGHPRFDIQTMNPEISLTFRWGGYLTTWVRHLELREEHRKLKLGYSL